MAYYYVKNGGTAVGDAGRYASQQTGSFAALGASGYYGSIQLAISATTSPIAADFINVSDLHALSQSGALSLTGINPSPFFVVSVDDANIENGRTPSNRGQETVTSNTNDVNLTDIFASGLSFVTNDDLNFLNTCFLEDCKITASGAADRILLNGDGRNVTLINSEIALNNASADIFVGSAGVFNMTGGSVTTTSAGISNLFRLGGSNGGMFIEFYGVDISSVVGNIIGGIGGDATNDDTISIKFDLCETSSGAVFVEEAFKSQRMRALFTRCSDSSSAAEYQYHLTAFGGDVDDDSAIFRNEDEAFTESNQKISYKIVTNSDASLGSPLWFDFPVLRYTRLSAGATDTLRFYITSNTALTDKDIYIEISYPDGTNKQTPNFLTSAPATVGGTLDLMATGTTLTTDGSSTWTGALSNLYQIDVDTSGDVGADCQPIVKVYVTLPSVTIQIASEYGLS